MFKKYLLIILLFHGVLSDEPDECVRYDFEDFDNVFPKDVPAMCGSLPWSWTQENYDNSTIAAPNEMSKWFIQATPTDSSGYVCTGSFHFPITPGGLVEANVYTETRSGSNRFTLYVYQQTNTGPRQLRWSEISSGRGWRVLNVTVDELLGSPPYQGYAQFLGFLKTGNIMIVDSFRYVPPSMDPENECILYEDTATTPAPTETPTTTPTPIPTTILTTTITTVSTTPITATPTTSPTDTPTTTQTHTTTPTTPITTPPKNLTNYVVEELFDFRKSVRIIKKRITKVGNLNELEQPLHGLE